ncbi:MAG: hypothetical protein NC092_12260 [Butyrivibrio sp.]|nr:hypothetical protein [Muribaculum sp.]MCM1553450.1 hypothetical protein [Butyrivibrio sp.]
MGNVYAVDAQKNLIIYSTGNYICLRTSVGENLTRPIVLCSDYSSDLSDIVYNNTIYYVYQNMNQDIILRSVMERDNLYKINSRSTPDCFYPQIAAIKNTLILFYFVKNPVDNSYCLKSLLPFQPQHKLVLSGALFSPDAASSVLGEAVFPSLPTLRILSLGASLLVHLSLDTGEYVFSINESLQCDRLLSESSAPIRELARYREESRQSRELLAEAQTESDKTKALLAEVQSELDKNNALLTEAQDELEKKNALLIEAHGQVAKLQSELSNRDRLIQSIQKQYEELMDTATKYKEEATKWYHKFYNRG